MTLEKLLVALVYEEDRGMMLTSEGKLEQSEVERGESFGRNLVTMKNSTENLSRK